MAVSSWKAGVLIYHHFGQGTVKFENLQWSIFVCNLIMWACQLIVLHCIWMQIDGRPMYLTYYNTYLSIYVSCHEEVETIAETSPSEAGTAVSCALMRMDVQSAK